MRRIANENGWRTRKVRSARREVLDHVIVANERHLDRLLREYVDPNNEDRIHTQHRVSPSGRPTEHRPYTKAELIGLPRVGRIDQ